MLHILSNTNSIANQFIAELRSAIIQQDRMRFRRNMERLGEVMAYEISKTFDYVPQSIETPLGIAEMNTPQDRVILATILRAGLPMHSGFLNVLDTSENAFISAYRKHEEDGSFHIDLEYITCPDVSGATLIVIDPMLASGSSMHKTIQKLKELGEPKTVHLAVAIAARSGLNYVHRLNGQAHIWVGDVDEELTAKSYVVPGLGDAGDLAFGPKVQE